MNSFAEIFDAVKERLDLTDTAMKLWIEPIQPLKLNNNNVMLYVKSPYGRQIVAENYTHIFEKHFSEILGFSIEVKFLCEDDLTPEQKIKLDGPITELQDDEIMVNKLEEAVTGSIYQHTFDTFIVGESNKLAYSACKAAAQGGEAVYNPLYIYSEPGLGKTHLLSAVSQELTKSRPELNIIYVHAEKFVSEFVDSVKYFTGDAFKKRYRDADILLVDDVQFFAGKKESQVELFHTFNELHSKHKQIILTSDRPPKEIINIEPRLRTRFEWGLLADISIPEFETRLAIIKRKAELLNLEIPNNVMEYMADKLKNNIRQLEGAILKMNALKLVTEFPPTIIMAQNVIRDVLTDQQPVPVTVEKIINEVASIYNVSNDEIRSQSRSAQISTARQVAIYIIHKITGLSYTAIGQEFGGRDHSTIVYAINKVKNIIKKDNSYRASIEDIIKNMGS
ncbi:MAG: chromosomal replication initiator protein DnaA [Oscillospiraceae bacterium]|nr:chromosomal replication initiator protein DnaA [Oscillospiraceae bacterium]